MNKPSVQPSKRINVVVDYECWTCEQLEAKHHRLPAITDGKPTMNVFLTEAEAREHRRARHVVRAGGGQCVRETKNTLEHWVSAPHLKQAHKSKIVDAYQNTRLGFVCTVG